MQRVGVKSGERWMFQDVHQGGPAYSAGIRPGDPERSGQEQVLTSSFAWESASLRLEIIPRPTAVTPIDSVLKQKSQAVAREDEVENDFQEKCTKGAKFARTSSIFGYTRRDKLFIFVGVGVFHPLSRRIVSTTHAPLRKSVVRKFAGR